MSDNLKTIVKTLLDEADNEIKSSEFFQDSFDSEVSKWDSKDLIDFKDILAAESIKVKLKDHYGGEGQGDEYWSVYSFTRGTEVVNVKFDGYYASHYGSEYQEWFFVEPKQVVVTQYEKA